MSTDYVTLLGAEDVRGAARTMREAAELVASSSNNFDYSLNLFKEWADDWLSRFQAIVNQPKAQITDKSRLICKHCGEPIEPTGGLLYLYTHVDGEQQKCTIAAPRDHGPLLCSDPTHAHNDGCYSTVSG